MIYFQILPLQREENIKVLVQFWPGCKLPTGMAKADKVTGPAEFRAKSSPAVGLNRQYPVIVAITLSCANQMCSM